MARIDLIRAWLSQLGILSAAKMEPDEAGVRITALADALSYKFGHEVFTKECLYSIADQFRFFPNYAEICDAIRKWRAEQNPYGQAQDRGDYPLLNSPADPDAPPREPYVVTSTPDWVGKHGRHFNPRPEPGELNIQLPIRTVQQQLRELGVITNESDIDGG